jgi:hypothetical protein
MVDNEYTWRDVPTADGKHMGIATSEPQKGSISCEQYDDGWRITQ